MPCKVKKEPAAAAPKMPPCLEGMKPNAVANKVKRKIDQLSAADPESKAKGAWLRQYYDSTIAKQKSTKSEEKAKFLNELMNATNLKESPFFERLRRDYYKESDIAQATWLSWKQVLMQEDEDVIEMSIAQGKIEVRDSIKLDHTAEETKQLPLAKRREYRYVTESEVIESARMGELSMKDNTVLVDKVAEAQTKKKEALSAVLTTAQRTMRAYKQQREDIEMRLNGYDGNEYPGLTNICNTKQIRMCHFFFPACQGVPPKKY